MTLHLGGLCLTLGQGIIFSFFILFLFFFLYHINFFNFCLLACFPLYFTLLLLYSFIRCCNKINIRCQLTNLTNIILPFGQVDFASGAGRSTEQNCRRGSSVAWSNPLPFYHFGQKRYPFRITFIDKWYPFHIPSLEHYIP